MKDLLFIQDGGETFVDGKPEWPVMIRVNLKRDQALDLAKTILVKFQNFKDDEFLTEIPLFGEIKDITE